MLILKVARFFVCVYFHFLAGLIYFTKLNPLNYHQLICITAKDTDAFKKLKTVVTLLTFCKADVHDSTFFLLKSICLVLYI